MRGLIYKECCLFVRGIEKRFLIMGAIIILFLIVKLGDYAGVMSSVMLAFSIGIQSMMSFGHDEKVDWNKYQKTLPIGNFCIVASKYISTLFVIAFGVCISIIVNVLSSLLYNNWNFNLWGISVIAEITIPLIWLGVCLPFTYWFGFKVSQIMGMVCIFPMIYLISFFEESPKILLSNIFFERLFVCLGVSIILYIFSFCVSLVGYSRNR